MLTFVDNFNVTFSEPNLTIVLLFCQISIQHWFDVVFKTYGTRFSHPVHLKLHLFYFQLYFLHIVWQLWPCIV